MKIVSWNVAGFRACLKKGFADFFNEVNADVVCLQEVKALESQIEFHPEGYELYLNPAERKGYSGTLVYTKIKPLNVTYGNDNEGRVITLEFNDFYLVTQYVPNAKDDLSRLDYRMDWEDEKRKYLNELEKTKPVVMCGDLNVAHQEIDLKNPKSNRGNAGFTDEEREKMTALLDSNFIDTFRYKYPEKEEEYTWWSYMGHVRERNIGWRIDYFVVSDRIKDKIVDAKIHQSIMGSDHCPIELDLDI